MTKEKKRRDEQQALADNLLLFIHALFMQTRAYISVQNVPSFESVFCNKLTILKKNCNLNRSASLAWLLKIEIYLDLNQKLLQSSTGVRIGYDF